MTPDDIIKFVLRRYPGTIEVVSWGERSVFHNPNRALPRGVYFLTVKENNGPNDKASLLDRDGVFRVNFGVEKQTFERLFGTRPSRPPKGGVVATKHDFAALDLLMPHPVYGWMGWLSVLSPSEETFASVLPLIDEAHALATAKFEARVGKAQ